MLDKMTNRIDFQGQALVLRAERQRVLASNIANADTPGYVARDFKFSEALQNATAETTSSLKLNTPSTVGGGITKGGHIPLTSDAMNSGSTVKLGYAVQTQPALDNNSVDLDRERANFVDNAVRYEATLRFLNGAAKTMLSAIQGQ